MSRKSEQELRGRIMAMETMLMVLAAHAAEQTDQPAHFMTRVMAHTEEMLKRAAASTPHEHRDVTAFALGSFYYLNDQVLAHFERQAPPPGQG